MTTREEEQPPGISEQLLVALNHRILRRQQSGEILNAINLPISKDEFPKVLCLDQNAWIYLSRSHYDKRGHPQGLAALDAIRTSVTSGRLVVPVTGVNAFEAHGSGDRERRVRLAEFMVDLSGNVSMFHEQMVWNYEVLSALLSLLKPLEPAWLPLRPYLLQRGMGFALGARDPNRMAAELGLIPLSGELMREPEISVLGLSDLIDGSAISSMRKSNREASDRVNEGRKLIAGVTMNQRRRDEILSALSDGTGGRYLRHVLDGYGVSSTDFDKFLHTVDLEKVVLKAPSFSVELDLTLEHDRNHMHETKANDFNDLTFLNVALVYANVVVMEKSWSHFAQKLRLPQKLGTKLLNSIDSIPETLRAIGCI